MCNHRLINDDILPADFWWHSVLQKVLCIPNMSSWVSYLRSTAAIFVVKWKASPRMTFPSLTAFLDLYKAGMTHIIQVVDIPWCNKKKIVVTIAIMETSPMVSVSIMGYVDTPLGFRTFKIIFAKDTTNVYRRCSIELAKIQEGLLQTLNEMAGWPE